MVTCMVARIRKTFALRIMCESNIMKEQLEAYRDFPPAYLFWICESSGVQMVILLTPPLPPRSTSMSNTDRRPLANTPVTSRIAQQHNNRFGAVLSALHSFWTVRDPRTSTNAARKDAYTCVLFGGNARVSLKAAPLKLVIISYLPQKVHFENDLSSNPNDLLSRLLTVNQYEPSTRFHVALRTTQSALENSWRDNL